MTRLRLGTRKSALAQTQSRWVADQLRSHHPDLTIETVLLSTSGDAAHEPVSLAGGLKAMFTKEIEDALLENRIDLAVHSLKDMTPALPAGLVLAAVPVREDPRDVWIGRGGISFGALPIGAVVGTSSVRRQAQLLRLRPDLRIHPLRGNVDTRLKKLETEKLDGIVLAAAGLRRLGRVDAVTSYFSIDQLIPAVGQGALGLETRESDSATRALLKPLNDARAFDGATFERAFLLAMNGSCQTPLAAWAQINEDQLTLHGFFADGPSLKRDSVSGTLSQGPQLAAELASRFRYNPRNVETK